MQDLPHVFVHASLELEGDHCSGIAADGLPPKWFTKNPATSFEDDDLPAMLGVIRHAADVAVGLGPQSSVFSWWWELYQAQSEWAYQSQIPSLLAGFGVSLMERAVMDAFCRQRRLTFSQALAANAFGIDLAIILLPFISFLRSLRVVRATRLARVAKIQQLSRMGRLYRLRGLAMRAVRALMILELLR